jgi:hypothetical protein
VLALLAATVVAGHSLLMPARVVAVATEGQWTSIAQRAGAHDCDRVSIWSIKLYRLGRGTSCTTPRHRIAALSEIDNRAVWLHVAGQATRTWTLWTATATSPSPKLLARIRAPANASPPIVLGPGNMDRFQGTYGEGDVLPYAIGKKVTVLNAKGQKVTFLVKGKRSLSWAAPSNVVTFATYRGLLLVATADGTVVEFVYAFGRVGGGWAEYARYSGESVSRVAFDGLGVLIQRGRTVTSSDCKLNLTLGVGEHLAGAGGGRMALLTGRTYRVIPGCGGTPVATGAATAFSLDSNHFVTASGQRVVRHQLPSG